MSKRNSIIIISLIVLLIAGGLIFFYFYTNQSKKSSAGPTNQNPFGTPSATQNSASTTSGTGQNITQNIKTTAQLIELYKNPTSGSNLFLNKSNQDVIRFVDRSNGNVYEYIPSTQTGAPTRLTNETIPKVQEAVWLNGGNNLAFRYLDTGTNVIDSYLAKITVGTSTASGVLGSITGSFITPNLNQLVADPAGNSLFGLMINNNETYGVSLSSTGSSEKQIFNSSVLDWNISWPKESVITMTTKPSYKYKGYLFFFSPQTGSMSRIIGGMLGLSTITNSDASLVAYSTSNGNSFSFNVYDVKNETNKNIQANTLADKCVWGIEDNTMLYCAIPNVITASNYPDAWYQGLVSFSDNIWSINTNTGETKLLYQVGINENAQIDVINPMISPDDQYISFMNKNDLSLWLLKINQ